MKGELVNLLTLILDMMGVEGTTKFAEDYTDLAGSTLNDTLRKPTINGTSIYVLMRIKQGILNYIAEKKLTYIIVPIDSYGYSLLKHKDTSSKIGLGSYINNQYKGGDREITVNLAGDSLSLRLIKPEDLTVEDFFIAASERELEIIKRKDDLFKEFNSRAGQESLDRLIDDLSAQDYDGRLIYVSAGGESFIEGEDNQLELQIQEPDGILDSRIQYDSIEISEEDTLFKLVGQVEFMTDMNNVVISFRADGISTDGSLTFYNAQLMEDDFKIVDF